MAPEYDFSRGVRGKHAAQHVSVANVVVLDPDVAKEFPSSDKVNETLRAVSKLLAHRGDASKRKTISSLLLAGGVPIEMKREVFQELSSAIERQMEKRGLTEKQILNDFNLWRKRRLR